MIEAPGPVIHFNRNLFPDSPSPASGDAPLWEENPPPPSGAPTWEGDEEENQAHRALALEEAVEQLQAENLQLAEHNFKLRSVLVAYVGILGAIEATAKGYQDIDPITDG